MTVDYDNPADYARIERAIAFLRERRQAQPDLAQLGAHLGLSPAHTQRLFRRWAGVSPKRFVQFLTVEYAKRRMRDTADLLGLALDSGLSGPGRLHQLFVTMEALSPGEFRRAAAGLTLTWGLGATPFGPALVVNSPRGICHLGFVQPGAKTVVAADLAERWPRARLVRDDTAAETLLLRVFAAGPEAESRLRLWVAGSNFQIQVWRALLRVPPGGLLSYRALAAAAGHPGAARAVGSALARNPVAWLIPCHRVLRETGDFGQYHWGAGRKRAICAWEAARRDAESADPESE
jgi:AraC family transcriptional regulator of adaptative response/methylated-DNA-[protein]-cysteine methyltransferase